MPTPKQKKLLASLNKFYQNPVAKVSLELFLSLFTIIFFGIFVIRPTMVAITDLIKEINDKQELEQQLERKIAALSTAQEEYNLVKSKIVYLDEATPSQPEIIRSLKTIEKIGADEKIIISSLRASVIPEEKRPQILDAGQLTRLDVYLTLQVMGDYPAIKNFIEILHQYRRVFVVEEINFDIRDRDTRETLRASITIRMPYFGDKDAQSI